jgi:hypothetical protein
VCSVCRSLVNWIAETYVERIEAVDWNREVRAAQHGSTRRGAALRTVR